MVGNVYFIDQSGSNFLFRGAQPFAVDSPPWIFDREGLVAALYDAAAVANKTLPPSFRIVDINLMQLPGELAKVQAEYQAFASDPGMGEFHFWETNGTTVDLTETMRASDPDLVNWLAMNMDEWIGDTLVQRVETLHDWLVSAAEPTVFFIHCYGGDDRTGELAGAYYMRWQGMSWAVMNEVNDSIAKRPFGCNNYRATQWYALYLVLALGMSLDYTKQCPCT